MISFMVLGGPRSMTTWIANFLTTDTTLCLHDPLLTYTRHQLDNLIVPGRTIGIACTSSLLYPEWINGHPAKKVVLRRDVEEINRALDRLAMIPLIKEDHIKRILAVGNIPTYDYLSLLEHRTARQVCEQLGVPFDAIRHNELTHMNVQPQLSRLPLDKLAVEQLTERMKELLLS